MASEVQGTNSERTGAAEAGAAWRSSIGEVIAGRSDGGVICGDCLDVMAAMDAASVDTIITDPPYGLQFMGKAWDHGVPGVPSWQAALRVAKCGAFLLAFGGTRTFHRLACAIEDAGWEIRDCMMWLYGQGFPKSLDISKAIDKAAGAEREIVGQNPNDRHRRENAMADYGLQGGVGRGDITAPATDAAKLWSGYGTALKPAWEPIIVAMKPTDGTFANNALAHGVAGLNIDGGRIAIGRGDPTVRFDTPGNGMVGQGGVYEGGYSGNYAGATKPHPDSMRHHAQGRWPANVILDEQSGQSASVILDEQSGQSASPEKVTRGRNRQIEAFGLGRQEDVPCFGDSGGASRFFYVAKASRAERNAGCEGFYWRRDKTAAIGHVRVSREVWATLDEKDRAEGNIHPTVKPLAVMEWLCKLTATPTGGVVLDPFAGSGSTCIAARNVGRRYIGIDNDAQPGSCEIARARLAAGPISPQSEGVGSRVVKGQRTLFAVGGAG